MDPNRSEPTSDRTDSRQPWLEPGHHWVSSFNYDPAARSSYAFPEPLTIFDSTIRKIMLTPGIRPSVDDLLAVAEALERVGVREVFLNLPWWDDTAPAAFDLEVCRAVLSRGFGFHSTVWTDALLPSTAYDEEYRGVPMNQVVDQLLEIGADTIEPWVGDPGDGPSRERQVELLAEALGHARSLGLSCALSFPDAGRMDFDYMVRVSNEAVRLGATRIDLQDSYSSLSPEGMKIFIQRFRSGLATEVPVTIHVHNDFGLASAAAIAAATAGAHPDVAVHGLSYRAGFAALEEVVVSLEVLYGVPTGIRMEQLRWLSDVVAERSGLPRHHLKAITGDHAFIRDLPTWQMQHLKGGTRGFPPPGSCIAPSMVGSTMQIVWGNHMSNAVIREKLRQMGSGFTEDQVVEIRRRIEAGVRSLESYPRWLTEGQVEAICKAVIG